MQTKFLWRNGSYLKYILGGVLMVNEIIFTITESLDGGYEANAVGYSIYTLT